MRPGALPGLLLGGLLLLLAPGTAEGQISLVEGDEFRLGIGGYLRSVTGVHDAGFDPPVGERRSAFNSEVLRLQWSARLGDRVQVEVHDRVQSRLSTTTGGLGSPVAGVGVSAVPGRAVDLESEWIDDERLRLWHDVDRLAVTVYTPAVDVTVGRQAVTWGMARLFPVADLWSRFSPYELDTEQKPGVDALRALAYPADGLEVDAVVADRGAQDDVSAGVRATLGLPSGDIYLGGGRLWNEALAVGGASWLFESVKVRAEATAGRDLDAGRWLAPRVTAGADWLRGRLTISGELHFNGAGADGPTGYLGKLRGDTFARGESYYLGRWYAGVSASRTLDRAEHWRLAGSALLNLVDGSGALSPVLTRDFGPATTVSLGGLLTTGETPAFAAPVPRLRSEYGTYGDLVYTRLSIHF